MKKEDYMYLFACLMSLAAGLLFKNNIWYLFALTWAGIFVYSKYNQK